MPEFATPHQHESAADATLPGAKRLCPYCESGSVGRSIVADPSNATFCPRSASASTAATIAMAAYAFSRMHAAPASKDQAA